MKCNLLIQLIAPGKTLTWISCLLNLLLYLFSAVFYNWVLHVKIIYGKKLFFVRKGRLTDEYIHWKIIKYRIHFRQFFSLSLNSFMTYNASFWPTYIKFWKNINDFPIFSWVATWVWHTHYILNPIQAFYLCTRIYYKLPLLWFWDYVRWAQANLVVHAQNIKLLLFRYSMWIFARHFCGYLPDICVY